MNKMPYIIESKDNDVFTINVKGTKPYIELEKENKQLKEQLEYIRSGEYYNQLRFERDMLQNLVDNGEISKEDKEFIDCTHRNTELLEENKKLNMQLDQALKDYDEEMQKNMKAIEYIENNSYYYDADGEIMFVIEEENEENFCKDVLEILKGDSNE